MVRQQQGRRRKGPYVGAAARDLEETSQGRQPRERGEQAPRQGERVHEGHARQGGDGRHQGEEQGQGGRPRQGGVQRTERVDLSARDGHRHARVRRRRTVRPPRTVRGRGVGGRERQGRRFPRRSVRG